LRCAARAAYDARCVKQLRATGAGLLAQRVKAVDHGKKLQLLRQGKLSRA